jgi:hypothetical protein
MDDGPLRSLLSALAYLAGSTDGRLHLRAAQVRPPPFAASHPLNAIERVRPPRGIGGRPLFSCATQRRMRAHESFKFDDKNKQGAGKVSNLPTSSGIVRGSWLGIRRDCLERDAIRDRVTLSAPHPNCVTWHHHRGKNIDPRVVPEAT